MSINVVMIDAATFEHQIGDLSETIAQKVKREGSTHLAAPPSLYEDMFISIRQAQNTYKFPCWIHSDANKSAIGWKDNYTFACAPLVRTLIDNLYNITLLLEDPKVNARWFRASGFRKSLEYIDAEEKRYKGKPEWDEFVKDGRKIMNTLLRHYGFTETEVRDKKKYPNWLTLGTYLSRAPRNAHKDFLDSFSYGQWKEYSAIAHGAGEGLHEIGSFLNRDGHLHEDRPKLDEAYPRMMSSHIMRTAEGAGPLTVFL